ncbi:MAG: hypothetical protein CMH62_03435 [Nanoarchaeota archaeon]|nr:hypothetical protein [Nanoarchaeota archaeon]|tara:strand:+ start:2018 stop:2347 length:330 start_codon:yes stop_codon:yes gene_type:complete
MEINKALGIRVDELKELMKSNNKQLLGEKLSDLLLLSSRVNEEHLNKGLIEDIKHLRGKIVATTLKEKIKETKKKKRKLIKIDDFDELCNLMKYQQFDEAVKKFNERKK